MNKKCLLILMAGAALLGGCDKQTQTNTEKIQVLTQKIMLLQQNQSKQLAAMQMQLASLPPVIEKISSTFSTKNHEEALFFHTNLVFLVLAMDKKIQAQFQNAESERETENALEYYYHTNQVDTMFFCVGQIEEAMASQEARIKNSINAETVQANKDLGDELVKQIKLSATDKSQAAQLAQLAARLVQIQSELDQIQSRLGITNPPATRP
jgi:hypothetical protein